MITLNRFERWILFVGDIVAFFTALWLMLFFRYGSFDSALFLVHLAPFSILFLVWILAFFIAGLYQKHTVVLKSRLPVLLFNTLIINTVLAIAFFYFIPSFGITPKTNLFIYLLVSFPLILLWRIYGYPLLGARRKQNAILIGSGEELHELRDEVNHNTRYSIQFVSSIDLDRVAASEVQDEVLKGVYEGGIQFVAIDLRNVKVIPVLPHLYNLIFSKVRFIDMYKVYEDIFDRVPLSLLQYNWFLEHISLAPKFTYDALKRLMDIVLSSVLLVLTLPLYPIVWFVLMFSEGNGVFSIQERLGKNNRPVKLYKFRTMTVANDKGQWGTIDNQVTRVGALLRKTRIDELPQLWNVLRGDISLIGPRPEFAEAVKQYENAIPYFNVRHLIKPGLSGWAQIHHEAHPHHGVDIAETKKKLSYDLYYIKNRSFIIDLQIALRTIRELVSRKGR